MMKEDLIQLKDKREFLQKSAEVMKKAREEFEERNAGLIHQINDVKIEEQLLINRIKKEAVDIYNVNGHEKSIGYGVKIQMKKHILFDENDALQWAILHQFALKLDVSAFKKQANIQVISCVRIKELPEATIPGKIEIGDE